MSIDLGMLQSLDYYTGVIFKGVTYDVGFFSVCGGGRYDTLIEISEKIRARSELRLGSTACSRR